MTRRVGAIIGVALVLALVWWFTRGGESAGEKAEAGGKSATSSVISKRRAARLARKADKSPARVSGTVRSESGEPIANAVVEVRGVSIESMTLQSSGEADLRFGARTDAEGKFNIAGMRAGTFSISASAKGHVPFMQRGLVLDPGEHRSGLSIELVTGGHRLSGTVSDIGGGPVAGAVVRVNPMFKGSAVDMLFHGYTTVSDANGRYEIYLENGSYYLTAKHVLYSSKDTAVLIADAPAERNFKLIPGGIIRGRVVTAEGEPVAGALIVDAGKGDFGFQITGVSKDNVGDVSDEEGKFVIRGLEPGPHSLTASAKGFASAAPVALQVGIAEEIDDVEIIVAPAYTISGFAVVSGQPETPVSGALIGAYNVRPGALLVARKRTASDGYFEIHGAFPGSFSLAVLADGKVPTITGATVTVEDQDLEDVLVEVIQGVTVRGQVSPPMRAQISAEIDFKDLDFLSMVPAMTKALLNTESAEDGSFELQGVSFGALKLVAKSDDGSEGEVELKVRGTDLDGVVIPMEERLAVSGRVVDTAGKPVADAAVMLMPRENVRSGFNLSQMMGRFTGTPVRPDGSFRVVGLEPGPHSASVRTVTGGSLPLQDDAFSQEIEVGPSGLSGLVLTVKQREGVVRGVVKDQSGPVADAMVRLAGGNRSRGEAVLTDSDGTFEFSGLIKGSFSLSAEGPKGSGHADKTGVQTGDKVTLELESYGSIRGTIDQPGRNCTAYLTGASNSRRRIAAAEFALVRLKKGDYKVGVTCAETMGSAETKVVAGQEATVSIRMGAFATLTGRVVDEEGEPVAGLAVFAEAEGGDPSAGMEFGMGFITGNFPRTGSDGRYSLSRVRPGKGRVEALETKSGGGRSSLEYEVRPGESKELEDMVYEKVDAKRVEERREDRTDDAPPPQPDDD